MKMTETKPWLNYFTEEQINKKYVPRTLTDYLLWRNEGRMHMNALSYYDNRMNLQDTFDRFYEAANAFASIGVKKGDIVLVCSACTPELIYTFYGLSLLGAASNMIDPRYSAEGLHEAIVEVDARLVVTLDVAYDKMIEAIKGTNVEKVIVLSPADSLPGIKKKLYLLKNPKKKNMPANFTHWTDFIEKGKGFKTEYLHDCHDSCVLIVHTGGTTGTSKSVMLSHDNINNVSFQLSKRTTAEPGKDSFLNVMPPFIAYGLGYGVHIPLAAALTCIIIPQLDPYELAGLVKKYKPQELAGVPAHLKILFADKRMKNMDLSFFKNCCCGGDSIPVPDEIEINKFLEAHNSGCPLVKGYGMTETTAVATACVHGINKIGSVGIPYVDFVIAAFDPETGEELEAGEIGEICISGPTNMMGYYNMPEETANVLRRHADGRVWVHSGDLGYMDEEGFLFIVGRIKRVIIRHDGFKVYPAIIEDALSECPDIKNVSVVGAPDREHVQGLTPHAFVVLSDKTKKSKEEVIRELKQLGIEKLAEYQLPTHIAVLDELPQTSIGKIDFKALEVIAAKQ